MKQVSIYKYQTLPIRCTGILLKTRSTATVKALKLGVDSQCSTKFCVGQTSSQKRPSTKLMAEEARHQRAANEQPWRTAVEWRLPSRDRPYEGGRGGQTIGGGRNPYFTPRYQPPTHALQFPALSYWNIGDICACVLPSEMPLEDARFIRHHGTVELDDLAHVSGGLPAQRAQPEDASTSSLPSDLPGFHETMCRAA